MSVYKRGKVWYINLVFGKARINRKAGQTKKEAKAVEEELKTKYRNKQLNISDIQRDVIFSEVATEFLEHTQKVKSPRTYDLYEGDWRNHLKAYFENYIVQDISEGTLVDFQARQKAQGLANRTVNIHMELVRKIINYAATKKYITEPILKYPMLPEPQKLHAFLTPDEYKAFKEHFSYEMAELRTIFARCTGLRPAELTYLTWADIDFEMKTAMIREKKLVSSNGTQKWMPKAYIERVAHLNKTALSILQKLSESKKGQWVFSDTDTPAKSIRKALSTAGKRAGLKKKVTPNMLRHTHATHALLLGGDLISVKEQMGHRNLETTQKYLHAIKEYTQKTVELLDEDEVC